MFILYVFCCACCKFPKDLRSHLVKIKKSVYLSSLLLYLLFGYAFVSYRLYRGLHYANMCKFMINIQTKMCCLVHDSVPSQVYEEYVGDKYINHVPDPLLLLLLM